MGACRWGVAPVLKGPALRLGGVRLVVHPGLLLLLAGAVATGLGAEAAVFAAVLAGHELAHALAAAAFDLRVREIEFLPFGGVADIEGLELADPGVEAVVAVAGPLHNLLCLAGGFLLQQQGWLNPARGAFFLAVNAALALANLLPALPLDGGRIVRAALAVRQGVGPATAWVSAAGIWVGAGLAVLAGMLFVLRGTLAPGLVVFSYFAFARARPARREARIRQWREILARRQPVREVRMVQHLAAPPEMPLRRMVEAFLPRRHHLIWRVEASGHLCGPWDEVALWDTFRRHGADAALADLPGSPGGRELDILGALSMGDARSRPPGPRRERP